MYAIARSLASLALVGVVASACGGATVTVGPQLASAPASTPEPTPAPTAAPTPVPAATPVPSTDGQGPEYVTGNDTHSGTGGTEVMVGDVTQVRNAVIAARFAMNDPRASGTGSGLVNLDLRGGVGPEWGTTRLDNAEGSWTGNVTGAAWANGNASDLSGWLVGSGAYEGYTYYWHLRSTDTTGKVDGIIYPGAPPAP